MSKTEYAYTTGNVGTATKVYNYTYGNTWKDQLTNFDSTAITYAIVPAFFHNRTKQAYEFASAVQGVVDFFSSLFVNN